MSYYELWVILGNWKAEFTAEEFASAFSSPDPRKVLYDMTSKGLLERLERGKYKVASPRGYLNSKYDVAESYNVLRKSRLPYALTGVDGVFAWTKGGYNANRFFGSYPIYIKVKESDVEGWREYLSGEGRKWVLGRALRETMYGTYYVLFPTNRVNYDTVGDLKVDPIDEVVEYCKKDPYTYAPALEMLDREYELGLDTRYAEPPRMA